MVSSACRVPSGPVTSRTLTYGSTLRYPCSSSFPPGRSLGNRSVRTRNFLSNSTPMVTSRVFLQPFPGVLDLFRNDHVAHVVFVPFDLRAQLGQVVAKPAAQLDRDERILQPVGREDGEAAQFLRGRVVAVIERARHSRQREHAGHQLRAQEGDPEGNAGPLRSEEHTSELQSR